jgi:hypothetical protein
VCERERERPLSYPHKAMSVGIILYSGFWKISKEYLTSPFTDVKHSFFKYKSPKQNGTTSLCDYKDLEEIHMP